MNEEYAKLTEPYTVYLAVHDVEVTLPAGTEFTLYAKVRNTYMGVYQHPQYGEFVVDTPDAVAITPLVPGMFILHGSK